MRITTLICARSDHDAERYRLTHGLSKLEVLVAARAELDGLRLDGVRIVVMSGFFERRDAERIARVVVHNAAKSGERADLARLTGFLDHVTKTAEAHQ